MCACMSKPLGFDLHSDLIDHYERALTLNKYVE